MTQSLSEKTAREPRVVESFLRATRAVLETRSYKDTARVVFDEARAMIGASSGYVALLSDDGAENELLFLEAGGLPCSVDPELPMPIRGLRADAYATQSVVYENDFMGSEWVELMPDGHVDLRNVLFAPLNVDGKTVGIMGLANKDGDFDDDDALLAAAYGEFAAIALRNSRTLDRLHDTVGELREALAEVRSLQGLIPICMHCKQVRDEEGYWHRVEEYVTQRTDAVFSHGLCERCLEEHYPATAEDRAEEAREARAEAKAKG